MNLLLYQVNKIRPVAKKCRMCSRDIEVEDKINKRGKLMNDELMNDVTFIILTCHHRLVSESFEQATSANRQPTWPASYHQNTISTGLWRGSCRCTALVEA